MDIFSNPALVKAAIEKEKEAENMAVAQNPILAQIGFNARQAGGDIGNSLAQVMGRPQQEDPRVAQVRVAREAVQGIDMTNPKGMMEAAQRLNEVGLTNEAVQLATKAKEIQQKDLIAAAQFNNSIPGEKDNSTTLEKQYEFIKKTAGKQAADKFLLSKQGSGQNITINTGDNVPLTKTQTGKVQEKIYDTDNQIARLSNLNDMFQSEYLEIPSKIGFKLSELKEKFGKDLSPEQEEALYEYSDFRSQAYDNLNKYIKYITGAQMSEKEAKRLRRAIPDPGDGLFDGDSSTQFKAKMSRQNKMLNAANLRYKTLLKIGIDISDVEKMAKDGSIDKYRLDDFAQAYQAIQDGKDEEKVMQRLEEYYGS